MLKNSLTISKSQKTEFFSVASAFQNFDQKITITIESHSKATILCDVPKTNNLELELIIEDHAECTFIDVSKNISGMKKQSAHIGSHAKAQFYFFTSSTPEFKQTFTSHIEGTQSESQIRWISLTEDSEHLDIFGEQHFIGPENSGEMKIRSIARGSSQTNIRGLINIEQTATLTNSYMKQDALILDPKAHIHTTPSLEIKTNNVKASHGAGISKIPADEIFYLQSRGLEKKEAEDMFIRGFMESIIGEYEELKPYLSTFLIKI